MTADIELLWQSTPALWAAYREGYCGCGTCHPPVGFGKTKEAATADLLEQEDSLTGDSHK
jgi:hypothetical protein